MKIYTSCRPAVQEDDTEIHTSCRSVVQEDDTHIYTPCRPAAQEDDTKIYASCRPVVQEDDTQVYTSCRPVVREGDTQILYNAYTPASYATLYFVECRGDKIPIGVYINIVTSHVTIIWLTCSGRFWQGGTSGRNKQTSLLVVSDTIVSANWIDLTLKYI